MEIAFLETATDRLIEPTPALRALAAAYVVAFKESAAGTVPEGPHPLPSLGVTLDFPWNFPALKSDAPVNRSS